MTREEWKKVLPFAEAFAHGERVQFNDPDGNWRDLEACKSLFGLALRIAPKPKLRPWTLEEIPVGAVVKYKETGQRFLIIGDTRSGENQIPGAFFDPKLGVLTASEMLEHWEWQWPNETEWRSCGVIE